MKLVKGKFIVAGREVALAEAGPGVLAFLELATRFNDFSNRAPASKRTYGDALSHFATYLVAKGGDPAPDQISEATIAEYFGLGRDAGLSAATLALRWSVLKRFFDQQLKFGLVKTHPMARLEAPKKSRILPRALSEEAVSKLLTAVSGGSKTDLRDRALIECLYGSGLRISEACNLTFSDLLLDENPPMVRVLGKGSKMRQVPLSSQFVEALASYLRVRPGEVKPSALVFKSKRNTPVDPEEFRQHFKVLLRRAGLDPHQYSPHRLRASYASHLLSHGADVASVKELLGHADLSSTQVYLQIAMSRHIHQYQLAHPRGALAVPASR